MEILLFILAVLFGGPAHAQSGSPVQTFPVPRGTVTTVATIATVNAFQQVLASALLGSGSTSATTPPRTACTIQYEGSGTGYVYFGAIANATTSNSFQLANHQAIYCNVGGIVLTDQVSVSSSATSDFFVITNQ